MNEKWNMLKIYRFFNNGRIKSQISHLNHLPRNQYQNNLNQGCHRTEAQNELKTEVVHSGVQDAFLMSLERKGGALDMKKSPW